MVGHRENLGRYANLPNVVHERRHADGLDVVICEGEILGDGRREVRHTALMPCRVGVSHFGHEGHGLDRFGHGAPQFVKALLNLLLGAATGILRGNIAVVIGAMVIAPLLGSNMALALSMTLGDKRLARKALDAAVVGILVAPVPLLVTCGMLIGAGHWREAWCAGVLVVMNIICINLAGIVTFLAQGIRPATWWEADRAKRATIVAVSVWLGLLAALVAVVAVARMWL